jgi:hypothetical protein
MLKGVREVQMIALGLLGHPPARHELAHAACKALTFAPNQQSRHRRLDGRDELAVYIEFRQNGPADLVDLFRGGRNLVLQDPAYGLETRTVA